MGRKSKLTASQWDEIGRRLTKGEKVANLAREYGVANSTISERFKNRIDAIKGVANQLVSAEESLRALSIPDQISAISLADEIRSISMHMATAGKYSAASAHRLSAIANAQIAKLDDTDPVGGDPDNLRSISAIMKMANDAAVIPIGLMQANKETVVRLGSETPKPAAIPAARLSTEALREIVAARNAG